MPMTERENLLRVMNGQEPAWLPRKGTLQFRNDPEDHKPCSQGVNLQIAPPRVSEKGGRIDMYGVEYEPVASIGGAALPVPNQFIMEDVTKWKDIVKLPDLKDFPWQAACEKAMANLDRENCVIQYGAGGGYFMPLMNMMGFTEGLIALSEEPEACHELFEYISEYACTIMENTIDIIKPDLISVGDDTAAARAPFISPAMYREMIKPYHARIGKFAQDRGLPVEMHCCGKCEDFIEDWRDFGVKLWNPAQIQNDLAGIKQKYGNDMIIVGGWDSSGPPGWIGSSEEVVRQAVRDCVDSWAPGGGFCFWGSFYGPPDDQRFIDHAFWITDEYNKYGRTYYERNYK